MHRYIYLVLCAVAFSGLAEAKPTFVFRTAKKYAAKIHASGQSLYCGCRVVRGKRFDFGACGYKSKNNTKRAKKLEWEHVVPASLLGKTFSQWKNGHKDCVTASGKKYKGRKCVAKMSKEFQKLEADLYNLFPSIAEINNFRKDLPMGIVRGEKREFGKCDVEISKSKVEPTPSRRGMIARIYLYMADVYHSRVKLTKTEEERYQSWDRAHPVTKDECNRYKRIQKYQKGLNPILEDRC